MLKKSFDFVADHQCEFLILGSMPGEPSLAAGQYYAHPRNLFWPFMEEIFDIPHTMPYKRRLQALLAQQVALWDVMEYCEREGSMDSNIKNETPNNFADFFAQHRQIRKIGFNGLKALKTFNKHVLPKHPELKDLCKPLPSTSPANASIARDLKLEMWREFFRS